jgi:hypothetical protein
MPLPSTINGAATVPQLAQWAPKAYHSLDTADLDESDDTDTLADGALIDSDDDDSDDDEVSDDPSLSKHSMP